MKPQDSQENLEKCICERCALFSDCNRGQSEKLFCARKKSTCPMDNTKMCICGGCPVYGENDLKGGYFCINEIAQ